jgi:RNA polymerase sigma factor (sigma-70 family)
MESQIIKKAIAGDSDALSILINKYKDIAYNLALGIVQNKESAKDITQESFLKVLENICRFRSDSKFSTWLYRIVYNQSIGFVQKVKPLNLLDNELSDSIEHSELPESRNDDYSELYKAIEMLEETERNVVMLFYLAEKKVKEISQITNLSPSNIKVILHRSRKKLQNNMQYERD